MPHTEQKAVPETELEDEEQATEDEQDQYDMLVTRAMKLMHGGSKDSILRLLSSGETPAKTLGQAAAMLVQGMVGAAKESGTEISSEVAMNAGAEIIELLSELGKHAGVFEFESDEEEASEMQDALLWGVKFFGEGVKAAGGLTPELQAEAQKEVDAGLAAEGSPPQSTVKGAVNQAVNQPAPNMGGTPPVNQPPGGIVNSQMQGGY